jgi:hypothetical protein
MRSVPQAARSRTSVGLDREGGWLGVRLERLVGPPLPDLTENGLGRPRARDTEGARRETDSEPDRRGPVAVGMVDRRATITLRPPLVATALDWSRPW